ncbi:hypothetical protein AMELA_G00194090 [Ameiurus melas]|uniref:Uncharacterized protein n=1 Tax=Ameiurus melas TaxID=219545 RepID=A0A7J6A7M7_AMEME|nr:hypothetical protein AMELA_G00194090 [Ameiurus melas]
MLLPKTWTWSPRLLSARLLKVSEVEERLAEATAAHIDEAGRENRPQAASARHEKALHRYSDTESVDLAAHPAATTRRTPCERAAAQSGEGARRRSRRCKDADAAAPALPAPAAQTAEVADRPASLGKRRAGTLRSCRVCVAVCSQELEKEHGVEYRDLSEAVGGRAKEAHDALQETQTLREEMDKLCAKLKERQSSEQRATEAEEQRIRETVREQEEERAKELAEQERETDRLAEREREIEKEIEKLQKQRKKFESYPSEAKGTRPRDGWDRDEEDRKRRSEWRTEEENGKDKEPHSSEQEIQAKQEREEEERRRKDQLLAKMREIDMRAQAQDSGLIHNETGSTHMPLQNQNTSIFSFTESQEYVSTPKTGNRGGALRSQNTTQDLDLTFGSYAPSFGKPAPRAGVGQRSPVDQPSGDKNGGMDLSGLAKEKKSNLMQQLFGSASLSAPHESPSKMELLSSPESSSRGRRRDAETTSRLKRTTLHVSESGPAVRAITTLEDDIEEVIL